MFSKKTVEGTLVKSHINKNKKYITNIFKNNKEVITWNSGLFSKVDAYGNIKKSNRSFVLDDIRSSYGIDFTLDIELEKDCLRQEKKRLKEGVENLTDCLEDNPNSEVNSIGLEKYKKELAKFVNRNKTYNMYCLRKKEFSFSRLNKLVASFLIVTNQVILNNGKFVYNLSNLDRCVFNIVTNFKSFDKLEQFHQRIFTKTYYIKVQDSKNIRKSGLGLKHALMNNKLLLHPAKIKFNNQYQNYIIKNTKKMTRNLNESDVKEILKALYEYRKNLGVEIESEALDKTIEVCDSFSYICSVAMYSNVDKIEQEIKKAKLKKLGIKKSNSRKVAEIFYNLFHGKFVTKDDLEKNYITKDVIEKNYVTNEVLKSDYVSKEKFDRLQKDFISYKNSHK